MNVEWGTDRGAETFATLRGSVGEPNVDAVLADGAESTPEEIIALADEPVETHAGTETVADETFEGFVQEEPRRVPVVDREPADRGDEASIDELFDRL